MEPVALIHHMISRTNFHLSCCLSLYPGDFAFNPLSPNIHIQILQTDPYIFPQRMSWESLTKDQSIFSYMIILLILKT